MSPDQTKNGKKIRVLIAEDDTSLMEIMSIQLGKKGFEILSATNGRKAIEMTEAEHPDVILLDLLMPENDGFEVLEHLKERGIDIPTIVLTNLGQEENCERSVELGARDCYVKSDTPLTTLEEKIHSVLD